MIIRTVNSNWQLVIGIIIFGIFLITIYNLPFTGNAQTLPEFMITWKANNYVPSDYQGKILPSDGTSIDVALELIDGGRLADLGRTKIRWFVDQELKKSGIGLKTFSFTAERLRREHVVEVALINYRGGNLRKSITIPVASPEVAIAGGPNVFQALLYFFNIQNPSQANFVWSANGLRAGGVVENPDFLDLDTSALPAGTEVNLQLQVQNLLKPLEIASKSLNFTTR